MTVITNFRITKLTLLFSKSVGCDCDQLERGEWVWSQSVQSRGKAWGVWVAW